MIIHLYGPDSYRRQQKFQEIVASYKAKHSVATLERFFVSNTDDLETLKNFLKNQSLFDDFKLAVVYPDKPPAGLAGILKANLPDQNTVVLVSADGKLTKDFDFLFKKPALSQSFEVLKPAQLAAFIKKEAEKCGLRLSDELCYSLIRANESDTWGIINDLEKLALGGRLEELIAAPNFFVLISRLKRGDLAALTWLLEKEEPARVFNFMASQNDPKLKTQMADLDAAIKSGKLEYEEALLDLALSRQ